MRRKRAWLVAVPTVLVWLRPSLVRVEGVSMIPTLRPGDRLLASRRLRPRSGDVVIALSRGTSMVKRITAMTHSDVVLEGDNHAAASTNVVAGREVIECVVLARLWPKPTLIRR